MIERDGVKVSKPEEDLTQNDLELVAKNYKAINLLYCSLNGDEFERTSSCTFSKEIWDKLVVTYEGTSQVKETKISIFLHKYELFKMAPNESIKEMFTRFRLIVNNLHSLEKTFTNEEKVRKILRCLPKGKWGPKVTAIEEAQDLKKLPLDDLLGKRRTHELIMQEDEGDLPSKVKNMSLKASKVDEPSSSDDNSDDEDDDPFALVARGLSRILKMRRNFKKGESSQSSRYPRGKPSNSSKSNVLTCFECGSTEYFIKDCPKKKEERKKDDKRKNYKRKDNYKRNDKKKAMLATWSDSDFLSDSENE